MKLTIVTICLDDRQHLDRCLRAIDGLDPGDWQLEVIVSDGGSTDGSVELAERRGAKVVRSRPGIPVQRNAGTAAATGDVIAHVDCDVELFQGFIDAVRDHYGDGRQLLLSGIKQLPADAHWVTKADTLAWMGASAIYPDGRVEDVAATVAGYCIVLNREVYQRVCFREDMPVDEDTMFVYDVEQLGIPVEIDARIRYIHHGEPRDFVEYFNKLAWNHNYSTWFQRLREGDRSAWRSMNYWWGLLFTGGLVSGVWPAAALVTLRAAVTSAKNRTPGWFPRLAAMYAGYGAACTAALCGYSKDKAKRWRKRA